MADLYYKNIKDQMLQMFFKDKKVGCDQQLFTVCFDRIFPCQNWFKKFLSTSGRDVMQSAAVQIVGRMLFESPWNGMQYLFENLLSFETKNLSESANDYVSQDHAVHSVQLYLLGIYCYFNYSVFHDTLFNYFLDMELKSDFSYTNREKVFFAFIESWKAFSLLHDFAYPYEALFDSEGKNIKKGFDQIITKFGKLEDYMYYSASMRHFAELILVNMLVQDSRCKLSTVLNEAWKNFTEQLCHSQQIERDNVFNKIKDWHKIKSISTNEDYRRYSHYFGKQDSAIIIKDSERNPVGLILYTHDCKRLFVDNVMYKGKIDGLYDMDNASRTTLVREGLHLEYYISGNKNDWLNDSFERIQLFSRKDAIDRLTKKIKNQLSVKLASLKDYDFLTDILYHITKFLVSECSAQDCIPPQSFLRAGKDDLLKDYRYMLEKSILQVTKALTQKKLSDYKETITYNEVCQILNDIKTIDLSEIKEQIENNYFESKSSENIVKLDCMECFQKIYNEFLAEQCEADKSKKIYPSDMKSLFVSQTSDLFVKKTKKRLEAECFLCKDDPIDSFFEYKYKQLYYDHGVVAGVLSAVYYNKYIYLLEKMSEKNIYFGQNNEVCLQSVAEEAVYAILVHNIYSKPYQNITGCLPQHTLLLNPLSFFCMYCDNLQVWDRNKGIDWGLVKWTGATLYGEDISISFEENKIRMICRTNDIIRSFKKLKEGLEEYLTGGKELLSLDLFEN